MLDKFRTLLNASAAGANMGSSGPEERADSDVLQRLVTLMTNDVRVRHNLPAFTPHVRLAQVARAQSQDLCRRRFFDHMNPDGESPSDRVARLFPEHSGSVAENIFKVDTNTDIIRTPADAQRIGQELIDGWMNSPGHRANILKPTMVLLGVGVYATVDDVFATQLFTRPVLILDRPLPPQMARGASIRIGGEIGPDLLHLPTVGATLQWPDSNRRFEIPGNRYVLGHQPLTTNRAGTRLTIDVKVGDQPGTYVVLVGEPYGGYPIGQIRVP